MSKDKDDSKIKEILGHIVKHNLLKGKCLKLYEFILSNKRASYRDIQKYMMVHNCIPMDHVQDLVLWGAIEEIGFTLHKETGAPTPVYQVTGKMPNVPCLVDYVDVFD
jgi:hypothetical protein